jgi:hypothetical protein
MTLSTYPDPQFCSYLSIDEEGSVHPLITSYIGNELGTKCVRIGTLMNGRCALGAILRAVSTDSVLFTPTLYQADRLRSELAQMLLYDWTDEKWQDLVPSTCFVERPSRELFMCHHLNDPTKELGYAVFYLYHAYDMEYHPRIYVIGQYAHQDITSADVQDSDIEVVAPVKNSSSPYLTSTLTVVPMHPFPDIQPRVAIVILHHGSIRNDTGHYETIGHREQEEDPVLTLFPLDHPLIQALDEWARRPGGDMAREIESTLNEMRLEERSSNRPLHQPRFPVPPQWRVKKPHEHRYSIFTLNASEYPLLSRMMQHKGSRSHKCILCLVNRRVCYCYHRGTATRRQLLQAEEHLRVMKERHFRLRQARTG